jgi:apolipoprotein N-acyltransferase
VNTNPRDVFDVHLAATQTLQPSSARTAVVWPENVINVSSSGLFIDSEEYTLIAAQAQRLQVPFVVGITESSGPTQFTNAQIVVEPDGTISSRYDKVRRVPFGEYMPMRPLLQAVGAPTNLVPRDARPGDARGWVDVDNQRVAVAISWEIFFGGRVNEGIVDGAGYIINPTNGSSYTWTILQTQQLASSKLRAREQGRWLVQVSPTGFSAFVSPNGEVFDRTGISSQHVVERTIEVRQGRTPYSRLGNGPYIWGLLVGLGWLVNKRTRAIRWRPS